MSKLEAGQSTHFSKVEDHYKKNGWGYAVDQRLHEGSTIDAIRICKRAALLRGFRFDEKGKLTLVYVEKRLLDRTPASAKEGIEMFKQQSGGEIGSKIGEPPVYKIILTRQDDGKFAVLQRSSISDQRMIWEAEYNRDIFRKPPTMAGRYVELTTTSLVGQDTLLGNTVGEVIENRLTGIGSKQKDLAEKVGVKPESLNRVIKGKSRPSARLLLALGDALNLSREQTQQLLALNNSK